MNDYVITIWYNIRFKLMCLKGQYFKTIFAPMAVVVAQLVEWSIPK